MRLTFKTRILNLLFPLLVLPAGLTALTGCSLIKPAVAPLPTGAITSTDAQINAILQAGHAAVLQYQKDVAAGFVPVAGFKTAMQQLTSALNVADPLYQSYHATLANAPQTAEPVALINATAAVQSYLAQIPTAAVGK